MATRSPIARLTDIIEAVELIRSEVAGVRLQTLESDRRKRWLVERGIEIISEASRHLRDELKARHPEIPWSKVAGIGNVLRHEYERVATVAGCCQFARVRPAAGLCQGRCRATLLCTGSQRYGGADRPSHGRLQHATLQVAGN